METKHYHIAKMENGRTYYVIGVDNKSQMTWTSKKHIGREFSDDFDAAMFWLRHFSGRPDVYIMCTVLTQWFPG